MVRIEQVRHRYQGIRATQGWERLQDRGRECRPTAQPGGIRPERADGQVRAQDGRTCRCREGVVILWLALSPGQRIALWRGPSPISDVRRRILPLPLREG